MRETYYGDKAKPDPEVQWRPMPTTWRWHEDITPCVPYVIELHSGEFLRGAFYTHNGSYFATRLLATAEQPARNVQLHEIKNILRLPSRDAKYQPPGKGL